MTTQSLSLSQARRIALAAQGFGNRKSGSIDAPANWRSARSAIRRMGLLQMDSINIIVRSHYMPVYSRIGPYSRTRLDDKAFHHKKRELFEYWAHEASLLPMDMHPLLRWRMAQAARFEGMWKGIAKFVQKRGDYIDFVYDQICANGPMSSREFNEGGKSGGMWDWHDGKTALEYLFWIGRITTHSRRGFERFYDLPERVLPEKVLALPTPDEDDAKRKLLRISAAALGIATEADLRDYFRLPAAHAKARVAELVEQGDLEAVTVEGWKQPAYLAPDARLPRWIRGATMLTPFDPIVWERSRTERLFNFRYRIEIYTPAHKRQYGYYVLPFLLDDRLVARVDLKSDRQTSTLRVLGAFGEDVSEQTVVARKLAAELRRFGQWLGLEKLDVAENGDLASGLKSEIS